MENDKRTEFEKSGEEKESGLFGVLIILGSTAAAPFIYTLF
jgi:hypothetical protein